MDVVDGAGETDDDDGGDLPKPPPLAVPPARLVLPTNRVPQATRELDSDIESALVSSAKPITRSQTRDSEIYRDIVHTSTSSEQLESINSLQLREAVENGNYEVFSRMIESGVDPSLATDEIMASEDGRFMAAAVEADNARMSSGIEGRRAPTPLPSASSVRPITRSQTRNSDFYRDVVRASSKKPANPTTSRAFARDVMRREPAKTTSTPARRQTAAPTPAPSSSVSSFTTPDQINLDNAVTFRTTPRRLSKIKELVDAGTKPSYKTLNRLFARGNSDPRVPELILRNASPRDVAKLVMDRRLRPNVGSSPYSDSLFKSLNKFADERIGLKYEIIYIKVSSAYTKTY